MKPACARIRLSDPTAGTKWARGTFRQKFGDLQLPEESADGKPLKTDTIA